MLLYELLPETFLFQKWLDVCSWWFMTESCQLFMQNAKILVDKVFCGEHDHMTQNWWGFVCSGKRRFTKLKRPFGSLSCKLNILIKWKCTQKQRTHWFNYYICFTFTDRSTTKAKTFDPSWNEIFIHEVTNAKNIGLTVFHDAAIPPDDFVANCTIAFEDLAHRDKEQQDFWVSVNFQLDACAIAPSKKESMFVIVWNELACGN